VSLVGYTNAGKSSVLRALAGDSQVFVEDRLFATLDPLTRDVKLGEHQKALVTDTVGFIRKLPHHLVASFRATLEEVNEADLLLHVIDASRSTWEDQVHVVDGVLDELGVSEKPVLHVFNKIDRLDNDALLSLQERVRDTYPDSIFVSALAEHGLEPLLRALVTRVRKMRPVSEIRIPASDGRLLAELHREGEVIDQRSEDSVLVLHVRATEALIGRLKRGGATVS